MSGRILFCILLFLEVIGCTTRQEVAPVLPEIVIAPVVTRGHVVRDFEEERSAGIFTGNDGILNLRNLSYIMKEGKLAAQSGQTLQFPDGKDKLSLYAYSPYIGNSQQFNGNMVTLEISSDQERDGIMGSDVLWGSGEILKPSSQVSLSFSHRFARLLINLVSVTNADLSEAKVTALSFPQYVNMNVTTGLLSRQRYEYFTDIVAHKLAPACYEVIVPPSSVNSRTPSLKIETGGTEYTYSLAAANFESGKEYTYNLKIWDGEALPFTVELSYKGQKIGSVLTIPAIASHGELIMTASSGYNQEQLRLRPSDGSKSWIYMDDGTIVEGWGDRLVANKPQTIYFEENTGIAERTLELEFYDMAEPQHVYKRLTVVQAGREDRLDLNLTELNTDRYGNEYDTPQKLEVSSNLDWNIVSTVDWIEPLYKNGGLNQTVEIIVRENKTGTPRTGILKFMVGRQEYKEFRVKQSVIENTSFTLKYELNLELNTVNGLFERTLPSNGVVYYPNLIEIYNHYTSDFGDATAKIYSENTYGFVTDFPACNSLKVEHFCSKDYFIYRNYRGTAATLQPGTITVADRKYSQGFFRQLRFTLPIPAGVKRTQKVVYQVVIDNIEGNAEHDPARVTYIVAEQK